MLACSGSSDPVDGSSLLLRVSASATARGARVRMFVHVEEQEGKVLGLRAGDDHLLARLPAEVLLWMQPRLGRPAQPISRPIVYSNLC